MATFRRWIRWNDWFDSKLAYLGTACYYLALTSGWPLGRTLAVIVRVFPFACCLAAFGYACNDYFDRTEDALAGKRPRGSLPGRNAHGHLVVALLGMTLVAGIPLATRLSSAIAALVLLGLSVAYSMPPLRLKTRGAIGVIGAAIAQWGTPVLPLLAGGAAPSWGFSLLLALGVSTGIRWMLLHQILDAPGDTRSGTRTFTREHGISLSLSLQRGLVMIETVVLVAWTLAGEEAAPSITIATGAYLACFALVALRYRRAGQFAALFASNERAPFRGLYLAWLPLGFLIALGRSAPPYLALVPIELLWKRHQLIADARLVLRAPVSHRERSR